MQGRGFGGGFGTALGRRLGLVTVGLALAAGAARGGEFDLLKFRSIGPAIGGRVSRVAGVPGDPLTFYAATSQSGVWKSVDGGHEWEPVFDGQPLLSTGAIAVAPSDPNVIYVGTGEANIRGNVQPGNGIYKSTDAGKSWKHVLDQEGQIGKIVVHPTNPDVAFAALLGHAFGPNPERGVYRTLDGGRTWTQRAPRGRRHRRLRRRDRSREPAHPLRRPLAGSALSLGDDERRRRAAGSIARPTAARPGAGSPGTACPTGIWGKVGVAVAPSDGNRDLRADRGGERRPLPLRRRRRRPGGSPTATMRSPSAPGTTRRSPSIRPTPTSSGSRRCRCCARSTAADDPLGRRHPPRRRARPLDRSAGAASG